MFWFILKSPTNPFNIIYDWNKNNLSKVVDKEEALSWYESIDQREYKSIKRFVKGRQLKLNLPIFTEWEKVTSHFIVALKNNRSISDQMIVVWIELLKEFDLVQNDWRIWFLAREEKKWQFQLPDWWLLVMKEFITWLFRFEPVYTWGKDSMEIPFAQNYDWVENWLVKYKYKGKEYETPVYWVYAPQMRNAIFWSLWMDFWKWRRMQARQIQTWYNMAKETVVAAPRWAGKSVVWVLLASLFPIRNVVSSREKIDWPTVFYYWESHQNNEEIIQKLLRMNKSMLRGQMFSYSDWEMKFMNKWEVEGRIVFFSNNSSNPGMWWRPTVVVMDESARLSKRVFEIASWFNNAIFYYISTINHETVKNEFYDLLKEAEIKMNEYEEDMDDVVVDLWNKYKLADIRSIEEFKTPEREKKLTDLKHEFFLRRPIAWFRFTIDDVEYWKPEEKQALIERKMRMWVPFVRAEYYSEFIDETSVFEVNKNIIPANDLPDVKQMEVFAIWLDTADTYDNPALCVVGWKWSDEMYVYESILLPKESDEEKIKILKETIEYYKALAPVFLAIDCTQAPRPQRAYYEDRKVIIDMPLQITAWVDYKYNQDKFMVVGKKVLVDTLRSALARSSLHIPSNLDSDSGLINELHNIWAVQNNNGKVIYKARSWKDDQVFALMYCVFLLYENWYRDWQAFKDNRKEEVSSLTPEDFDERVKKEELRKRNNRTYEDTYDKLFWSFGF